MPDAQPIEPTDAPATGAQEPTDPPAATEPDPAAEAAKWKALARKHEEQSKANADKAKRFDALEEASKSELEKAVARAEAAEKAAAEAASKVLRADVAAAKGVPAALLSGTTQDELEAAADALLAFKGVTPKAPTADGQGKVGTSLEGTTQLTDADVARMTPAQINEARRAGRLANILGK